MRPRRTVSAQDPAWLRGPLTRDSQHCTRKLAPHERAEARGATKPRGHLGHRRILGGPTKRCTSGRGMGRHDALRAKTDNDDAAIERT